MTGMKALAHFLTVVRRDPVMCVCGIIVLIVWKSLSSSGSTPWQLLVGGLIVLVFILSAAAAFRDP